MEESEKNWKLKLRYGKLATSYHHFTVIAKGVVAGYLTGGFDCPKGNALMGMKIWAESADQAGDITQNIGLQIGFTVTGNIEIFKTDPLQPPTENPFCYDITFTPFANE